VRAFVGIDAFEIQYVTDDVIFIRDAVSAMHVTRDAGNLERLATVVSL
jgi:hypothetical protein